MIYRTTSKNTAESVYDELSKTYDEKYVEGGIKNPYMVDEVHAAMWWTWANHKGNIVSLGVGSGQDIEILDYPEPDRFTGFDISSGMLENARRKFPGYAERLIQHDCTQPLPAGTRADVLVSMFGAPNYLGIDCLLEHYERLKCGSAFFVFYNENYDDGVQLGAHYYNKLDLLDQFREFQPSLNVADLFPGSNYYVVTWHDMW